MKSNYYNEKNIERYGIKITSVSDFIEQINVLKGSVFENSVELFFRGQKNDFWNLEPSIFRNNHLSVEHRLMEIPLLKTPYEFLGLNNDFEIMTKYQHYNMCTRLLDLTTNPLVSLYFACEKNGVVTEKEPFGLVYYNKSYPISANDQEVKIITALSKLDLSKDNKYSSILKVLVEKKIISVAKMRHWLKKEHYQEFIKIIQSNYVISPTYSNERLSRQSGYFLLAGSFLFYYGSSLSDSIINKARQDLRHEFEDNFFYIDGNDKNSIIEELDTYNINESTLFPELEHQLNYIKTKNSIVTFESDLFIQYEDNENLLESRNDIEVIKDNLSENKDFEEKILDYLKIQYNYDLAEQLWDIIKEKIKIIDWYKQKSILSELRIIFKKLLSTNGYNENISENIYEIQSKIFEFGNINNFKCK